MKKILAQTRLFLLGVVFFIACNNNSDKGESAPPKTQVPKGSSNNFKIIPKNEVPPKLILTLTENGYPVEDNSDPNYGYIDFETAKKMSILYRSDISKKYINGSKDADATSIWFSLNTLKNFIKRIEDSVGKQPYSESMGVRFYYAKYPAIDEMQRNTGIRDMSIYANYHTIFMVPTYFDTLTRDDVDFNIHNIGPDKSKPLPYYRAKDPVVGQYGILVGTKFRYVAVDKTRYAKAANHGGLAPPPEEEGAFPTPDPVTLPAKKASGN